MGMTAVKAEWPFAGVRVFECARKSACEVRERARERVGFKRRSKLKVAFKGQKRFTITSDAFTRPISPAANAI